jgi:hypothetical protein
LSNEDSKKMESNGIDKKDPEKLSPDEAKKREAKSVEN